MRLFLYLSDEVILDLAEEINRTEEERRDEQVRHEIEYLTRDVTFESVFRRGS